MFKFFNLLAALLLMSACATIQPIAIPPEGTAVTTTTETKTTTVRPIGRVAVVTDSTFQSGITIRNTPPRYRQSGPFRGETILACNRVGDVWQYLDTGYAAPNFCRYMQSTDARPRSTYVAASGRCYTIMEFGEGFQRTFTAIPGGRCQQYRRY